jgi:hypothetical protein
MIERVEIGDTGVEGFVHVRSVVAASQLLVPSWLQPKPTTDTDSSPIERCCTTRGLATTATRPAESGGNDPMGGLPDHARYQVEVSVVM